MATAIPKGKKWVRDVYPDAKWDGSTKTITLPTGRKLAPGDYDLIDSKAYFNPITPGNLDLSSLVPGAKMNDDRTINLGDNLGTIEQKDYEYDGNGSAYVDPSVLSSRYAADANKPRTPEQYAEFQGQVENERRPLYNQQSDKLNRLIQALTGKIEANIGSIDASGDRARAGLNTQEQAANKRLIASQIARGTYTSGYSDAQSRGLAGEFAPQYSLLEGDLSAQRQQAYSSADAALGEISSKGKDLERDFMSQVAQGTDRLFTTEQQKKQKAFENFATIVGQTDKRAEAIIRQLQQKAQIQDNITGKVGSEDVADYLGAEEGDQTLSGQRQDLLEESTNIDNALKKLEGLGAVPDQATADALGVAIGTSSYKAKEAAANRKAAIAAQIRGLEAAAKEGAANRANITANNRENIASSEKLASNAAASRERAAAAAADAAASKESISDALAVWKARGTAPNSAALKKYGINPGDKWNQSAVTKVKEAEANATLKNTSDQKFLVTRGKIIKGMLSDGGIAVDDATALVVAELYDAGNYNNAKTNLVGEDNLEKLKKMGVNVPNAKKALKYLFEVETTYSDPLGDLMSNLTGNPSAIQTPDLSHPYSEQPGGGAFGFTPNYNPPSKNKYGY